MSRLLDTINGISKAELVALHLQKGGGEGSRGGKIMGHTSSGKPIYGVKGGAKLWSHEARAAEFNAKHANHSHKDHTEAAKVHRKAAADHLKTSQAAKKTMKENPPQQNRKTNYRREFSEAHQKARKEHNVSYAMHELHSSKAYAHEEAAAAKGSASKPGVHPSISGNSPLQRKSKDTDHDLEKGMYDDEMSKNLAEVKKLVDSGKKVDDAVRAAYPDYSDEDVLAAVRAYGKRFTDPKQPDLVRSVDAIHNYSPEVLAFYRS